MSRFLTGLVLVTAFALSSTAVSADEPPKQESNSGAQRHVRISPPGESYIDPEILQSLGTITFQQRDKIWVGDLDPETGLFKSDTGCDYLMDAGAARLGETFNGPEFSLDARGWAVFYAKENKGTVQIWRSVWEGKTARAEPLTTGERHQSQLASKHAAAESTRLLGIRGSWRKGHVVWLDTAKPSTVHEFAAVETGVNSARWVDGTLKFVFSQRTGEARGQISLFDTASGNVIPLTDDAGDKTDPYGWLAPEHGNQLLVLAVVDDQAVAVFKNQGKRHWDRIATLTIPPESKHKVVGSAEPFVAGGKSYIALTIKSEKARIGRFADGEVWVFGIEDDPKRRFARRCDDGQRPVARFDPEIYVGKEEVFVYYNVLTKERVFEVRRSRTGIAAKGGGLPAVGAKPSEENRKETPP